MERNPVFLIAVAVILVETLAYYVKPTLLTPFAFFRLASERRVRLPEQPLIDAPTSGYRERGRERPERDVPALDVGKTTLGEGILEPEASGRAYALRRRYEMFGNRNQWLVRIELSMDGDELVMRAKQAFFPMTIVFLPFAQLLTLRPGVFFFVPAILAVLALVMLLQHLFGRHTRDGAIEEAFDVLESEALRASKAVSPRRIG